MRDTPAILILVVNFFRNWNVLLKIQYFICPLGYIDKENCS